MKNHLYGREEEIAQLSEAYDRCLNPESQQELVLITGPSGSGKTALAQSITSKNKDGYFLTGKYDQLERPVNYLAFVQALTEFCDLVTDTETFNFYKLRIAPLIHTERILTDLIPALEKFASSTRNVPQHQSKDSGIEKQIIFSFRQLFKKICSIERPIVLFLDDLQWADLSSLRILGALAEDTEIHGLCIIGASRGNEVSIEHRLSVILREMEAGGIALTDINLKALSFDSVQKMVSDEGASVLASEPDVVNRIWDRSKGNPFFAVQLIRAIVDDGLSLDNLCCNKIAEEAGIVGSMSTRQYLCSIELIGSRLQRLSKEQQDTLMIGACMGALFNEKWVARVLEKDDVNRLLCELEELEFVSSLRHSSRWRFTHDQIQQGAYMLIPKHEREEVHLMIGRKLWSSVEAQEDVENEFLLLIVSQLMIGARLVENEDERVRMAQLLLDASSALTSLASFKTALDQLTLAIHLLGNRPWRDHYDLSLALFCAAAEVSYYLCDFEGMERYTHEVIANARSKQDKLRPLTTKVYCLGSTGDLQGAIDLGLDTLKLFDQKFPIKAGIFGLISECKKTKKLLKDMTDDDILSLPTMEDRNMKEIVGLMNILFGYTFLGRPMVSPLLAFRLVQLTVGHGLSGPSCVSFGAVGLFFCNGFGTTAEGYRFARLGVQLMEKLSAYEWSARVSAAVCNYCFPYFESLQDQLKPLLVSHRLALTGDIEFGLLCGASYCGIGFYGCLKLEKMVEHCLSFYKIAENRQQTTILHLLSPYLQFALNMTSSKENPTAFSGSVLDADKALLEAVKSGNKTALSLITYVQLVHSVYFEDYGDALKCAEVLRRHPPKNSLATYNNAMIYLYSGITYAEMCDGPFDRKRSHLKHCIKGLKKMQAASVNFENKVLFLEAELLVLRRKEQDALDLYEASIVCAKDEGLWNEMALAYERASRVLFKRREDTAACVSLMNAIHSYRKWGAKNKADILSQKFNAISLPKNVSLKRYTSGSSTEEKVDSDMHSFSVSLESNRVRYSIEDATARTRYAESP